MPSILFVCTANQIRSPFAAAYFQKLLQDNNPSEITSWQIESAGTWIKPGLPADSILRSLEKRWDLNLNHHLTRQVDENQLDSFDLVLVMEKGQLEALNYEFPQFSKKIMLLTVFYSVVYDIDDPRGQGINQYEKCLEDIAKVLSSTYNDISKEARQNYQDKGNVE